MAIRSGFWPRLLWAAAFIVQGLPALAGEADVDLCERAIVSGAGQAGIPASILGAISLTETGRYVGGRLRPWPWAINREGQSFWFATRDEALAFARESLAAGRTSFDVGCFQINYRWHGRGFASLEAMFDQQQGGLYAARFLRDLYGELGSWSAAAGAYHSRTPEFAEIYRARFDQILAGLGDAPLAKVAAEAETAAPDAKPRKSRTKMVRRPLIITIDPTTGLATPAGDPLPAPPDERADRGDTALATGIPDLRGSRPS